MVAILLSLKGIGGLLFVFGSSVGAYLLVRIHPVLNFSLKYKFVADIFILGVTATLNFAHLKRKYCLLFQLLQWVIITPVLYDFFTFSPQTPLAILSSDFLQVCSCAMCLLLSKLFFHLSLLVHQKTYDGIISSWQHIALFGALLFFIGMKNTAPKRQPKKKTTKTKTY